MRVETLGKEALINCAKTAMSSKIVGAESEFFSQLVVEAVTSVKTEPRGEVCRKCSLHLTLLSLHFLVHFVVLLMSSCSLITSRTRIGSVCHRLAWTLDVSCTGFILSLVCKNLVPP